MIERNRERMQRMRRCANVKYYDSELRRFLLGLRTSSVCSEAGVREEGLKKTIGETVNEPICQQERLIEEAEATLGTS